MNFHILTLFPEMILEGLGTSILGRAAEKGHISIEAINIRDYSQNKHKKVDDYPYGGGAGMLMQAQPVFDAYQEVTARIGEGKTEGSEKPRCIYLTPQGRVFSQNMAQELAGEKNLIFLCGHYEGIDERVLEEIVTDYVSIGDYVLTGGELPAMVMIDAISRLVPGVLNNESSAQTESFFNFLLEYPQYSRPEEWKGKSVPEVLLSGNHKKIAEWRKEQSIKRTKLRRPDLYDKYQRLLKCESNLLKNKLLHMDMLELIRRGQGILLSHETSGDILLYDRASGMYMMTASCVETGLKMLETVRIHTKEKGRSPVYLTSHQDFMSPFIEEMLQMKLFLACYHAVYTRKELLPVPKGIDIRKLENCHISQVAENYTIVGEPYIRDRIESGCMWGAFVEDALTGFVGIHKEGSIGMLEVFPAYRGRGIAKALQSTAINWCLENGHTPYGQVSPENEASIGLQKSLGTYFSKGLVYLFERNQK